MLRRSLISVLLLLACLSAQAKKRVFVEAEVKNLVDGKVTTVTKRLLCERDGRLVTVTHTPTKSYLIRTLKGEAKLYLPSTNEVLSMVDPMFSTSSELVYIFLIGHTDDLGLISMGYTLKSSRYDENGYLVRSYTTTKKDIAPYAELVLKDYLPIYAEYKDHTGKTLAKSYLSGYDVNSRFVFPTRVTDITFNLEKKDSTITRTIFSGLDISGTDPDFDFQVPKDAKPAENPLKKLKEAAK